MVENHTAAQLRHEHDEAISEIARHHELIALLRAEASWLCYWILRHLPDEVDDNVRVHIDAIERLVNRHVG